MNRMQMDHLGIAMSMINGRPLTDSLLEEVLGKLQLLDETLDKERRDDIRKQLEHTIGITMSAGEVIREVDHKPWLSDAKGNIEWHYWDSYKRLLKSRGWADEVISVLDEDTDNILTECGNPSAIEGWNLRGLVMGDVQSGKTANYNGLIAKAADGGYKVIVLLTGMIEDLRKQTQERMDEGFVGRNSRDVLGIIKNMRAIGAGIYRKKSANVLTSVDSDFLTNNAKALGGIPLANINEPVLFVVKKNISPLENLILWLDQQLPHGTESHDLPLLIVDDEADNASVNTRKDEDPAAINRLIREVLGKFSRASYVAYTATPFANVFINPDNDNDLFPSNFIYSLNSPSHYIGADRIFLEESQHHDQLRIIDDAEDIIPYKHKKDLELHDIPESLKRAVKVFMLSCAIRDARREKLRHRSMLVNVSRFTNVQAQVAEELRLFIWGLKEEIRQYLSSTSWSAHPELLQLQEIWNEEFSNVGITWDSIRRTLHEAIASITVVTINQNSEEKLNYSTYHGTEKGRRAIAVGGLTLSRGLTLEGLCVSYFYRNSKAYDTLLQMGRWFGYRHGYEDVFRIWMDETAVDWYAHIATAINELRADFRRMSANRLPPSQFGIRVKSHPDTLIVTAQNKMRNSKEIEHSVSFSACGVETPFVPKANALNLENVKSASAFIQSLGQASTIKSRNFWAKIDKKQISDFLYRLNISSMNMEFLSDANSDIKPLIGFIADNNVEDLQYWDVCIPQGKGNPVRDDISLSGSLVEGIKCRTRQFEKVPKNTDYLKLNKQRVGDASDDTVGMKPDEEDAAEKAWAIACEKDPSKKGKSTPGYIYRRFRARPLLTIHFIRAVEPGAAKHPEKMMHPDDIDSPVIVAISLSFPDFDRMGTLYSESKVVYRLNKIAIKEIFGDDEEDGDDED